MVQLSARASRYAAIVCCVLAVAIIIASMVWWTRDTHTSRPTHDAATGLPLRYVDVTLSDCAPSSALRGGSQVIRAHNTTTRTMDFSVRHADNGAIVVEVEPLGNGVTRDFQLNLGAGKYQFVCSIDDDRSVAGAVSTITDPSTSSPDKSNGSIPPITAADLVPVVTGYRAYVGSVMPELIGHVDALRDHIRTGSPAPAVKSDWLAAHHDWISIGAVYEAFGETGENIDGLASGLANGVNDPDFTGFHAIENLVWSGRIDAATAAADKLDEDIHELAHELPTMGIDHHDLPLRTHEIFEDIERFDFTGESDYGSHSYLSDIDAATVGTRTLINLMRPILASRMPRLAALDHQLDATQTLARVMSHQPATTNVAVGALDPASRDRLTATVASSLEMLAPIAVIGNERRNP